MSFLSPLFLFLGAAAAVPLLIHLLRRRVGSRMEFPAVRYLLRAEQENRRTLRLRNLLLMILRVAAVLLLSIAAARPIGRMIGTGHAPAAIAIVIDNSLSSSVVIGGRSMLDRFKAAAAEIVDGTTSLDRVWLVTADGAVAGGSGATIRAAVSALQATSVDADLPSAVRRAGGLARAAGQSAPVVIVLTDAQRTTWPSGVSNGDVRTVVWSPALMSPENHAVSFVEARPIRWTPHGAIAIRVRSRDSLTYRVTLAGRTLARGTAAPNEEAVIHASPAERGWVGGSVDLAPDELAADDIRYFAVWIGAAPTTYATSGAGEFVVAALDALHASDRLLVGAAPTATGGRVTIGPVEEVATLPALLTAPSDPVHLGAANRALDRLAVPWRFGARRTQAVDVVGAGIGSIPVADRYDLVPQAGADADTLAAAGQSPWIVAGPRYVLVGSPLTAPASALPVRAAFVPWLASTLADRLAGEPGIVVNATPGLQVKRPAGADQLERPDGSRVPLAERVITPTTPGVYFFLTAGRRSGAVVVNPPARESELERLASDALQRTFPDATLIEREESSALSAGAFRASSTRSLLPPVLVAVLAVLFAEALVVTTRRRETT